MKITIVCENRVSNTIPRGLVGEHGLAILLEGSETILFDTGQGMGLLNNLALFGKDINAIDKIILSHGHYDHVGGLWDLLQARTKPIPVYVHADAFIEKLAVVHLQGNKVTIPIGFKFSQSEYEKAGAEFIFVNDLYTINDAVQSISNISRDSNWKGHDERLKTKGVEGVIDDPFTDDLSLIIHTDKGDSVILGCAHAGLVEILDDISQQTGIYQFNALIGGTHLGFSDEPYFEKAIEAIGKYKFEIIGTSHCTGFEKSARILSKFKSKFKEASVGSNFDI